MKKLSKISMKKKVTLIFIILLIVAISIGITFAKFNNNIETSSDEITDNNQNNIPDVSVKNIKLDISETETTSNNVIITVTEKLKDYNLYYYVDTLDKLENNNEDSQEKIEENEQEEIEKIEENNNEQIKETKKEPEVYILYQDKIELESNSNIYFKYEKEGKYSGNSYMLEINNIDKQDEIEEALENESATEEELQQEEVTVADQSAPYYVIVNYSSNVVTIYKKDANNKYTIPVKAMVCSTGVSTPRSGVYKLTNTRYKWRALFGGVYGQYAVKIVGNILFHSVPYLTTDNGALEYWEYDKLGTAASAGCIRLKVEDALWIYNNCGSGTQVEFSANAPDPLGKPSAMKISAYESLRGYDPTDPIYNNPWKNANISSNANNISSNNNNNNNSSNASNEQSSNNNQNVSTPTEPQNQENTSKPNNNFTTDKSNTDNQNTNNNKTNTNNTIEKDKNSNTSSDNTTNKSNTNSSNNSNRNITTK